MHAGAFLKCVRHIKSNQIKQRDDFGDRSTEPYSSYQHIKIATAIPINEDGECIIAKEILPDEQGKVAKVTPKNKQEEEEAKQAAKKKTRWECSSQCKIVTEAEVECI